MKNKPLIFRFISWLLGIAVTVVLFVAGAYVVIKMKYDVDIFATIKQVRQLSQKVDEDSLLANKFEQENLDSAVIKINASLPNLITKDADDNYQITTSSVSVTDLQSNIKMTDKEWGSLLNTLFIAKSAEENPIKIGNETLPYEFIQLDFSDYSAENHSIKFTTVFKLDARAIKNNMKSFPMSLIKNYIPDYFYLFATTSVTKTDTAFEYTLENQYLKANNLTVNDTMSLFSALNKFLNFGEPQELASKFVNVIADGLLNAEKDEHGNVKGFMGIMKEYNASDFAFSQSEEIIYLEVIA